MAELKPYYGYPDFLTDIPDMSKQEMWHYRGRGAIINGAPNGNTEYGITSFTVKDNHDGTVVFTFTAKAIFDREGKCTSFEKNYSEVIPRLIESFHPDPWYKNHDQAVS